MYLLFAECAVCLSDCLPAMPVRLSTASDHIHYVKRPKARAHSSSSSCSSSASSVVACLKPDFPEVAIRWQLLGHYCIGHALRAFRTVVLRVENQSYSLADVMGSRKNESCLFIIKASHTASHNGPLMKRLMSVTSALFGSRALPASDNVLSQCHG